MQAHNSVLYNHIFMFGNEGQSGNISLTSTGEWLELGVLTEPIQAGCGKYEKLLRSKTGIILNWMALKLLQWCIRGCGVIVIARTVKWEIPWNDCFCDRDAHTGDSEGGRWRIRLGMRALRLWVIFTDCESIKDQVLGEARRGIYSVMKVLDGGRIFHCCLVFSIAKGALEGIDCFQRASPIQ